MQSSVKEEFVKKWIKGLQRYKACNKQEMTLTQRKNAIKLSADIAMASTSYSPAIWRRSIIAKTPSKHGLSMEMNNHIKRCWMKRVTTCRRPRKKAHYHYYSKCRRANSKRLVKKRKQLQVLKGIIPGGECMKDGNTLIKETLDYILSLRLQVDVMRHLAASATR